MQRSTAPSLSFRVKILLAVVGRATWAASLFSAAWLSGALPAPAGLPGFPVEMWEWDPATHTPDYPIPIGVPIVCQLTDDDGNSVIDERDDTDVLILTTDVLHPAFFYRGAVTALDGATGAHHFTVSSPLFGQPATSGGGGTMMAVGDVDDDGIVEIVLSSIFDLIILEHDGTLKSARAWPTTISRANESLGLADFNQDGVVEAYTSTTVLSVDGSLSVPGAPGSLEWEAYSVAVDLTPHAGLELLVGNRLFDAFGTLIWHRSDLPDGSTAVGDCDGDGDPEVYLATRSGLHVLDAAAGHDLAPVVPLVGDRNPSPAIADFDGDGLPEIAVASERLLYWFDFDGVVLTEAWRFPIHDVTGISGLTAFDFDGDDASELLYRDEFGWYAFNLFRRSVFSQSFPSGTGTEYPVAADLDGDCTAEIVVTAALNWPGPETNRVRAFKVPGAADARAIWNQQAYHVTNVEDDGSIPVVEPKPWETHGTWLGQAPGCIQGCEAFIVSPAPGEETQQCDGFALDVVVDPQASSPAVLWTSSCPDTIFLPSDDVPDPMAFLGTDCDMTCELTVTIGDDECTDSVTVTVNDTELPTIAGAPSDDTVECDAVPAPATPTVADNCDDAPELRFEEVRTPGPCEHLYMLDRTWTAEDSCGNEHSETQRLSVVDTTPPRLVGVPEDDTVECDTVPAPAGPIAEDDCDDSPEVRFEEMRTPGPCPHAYTLDRTWTAEDACGNVHSETQRLSVVDTTLPTLVGVPADDTVECDAVPAPASPIAEDDCDSAPELRFEEIRMPGPCPQSYTLDRTWTVRDACGNEHSETQRLSVVDTTPPNLIGVPPNETAQCDAVPAPATVTAEDSCDPSPMVMLDEARIDGSSPDQYELHRTWAAEDACGNRSAATQVVTVVDTVPPVPIALLLPLSPLPPISEAALRSACSAPTSRSFEVTCSATDNCDPMPALSSRLLVENHDVNALGECVLRVESIDVECGGQVEVRLVSAPCPADPPRRPQSALTVNSLGVTVVTGESVVLQVIATDRTGNVGTASHDPTVAPDPPCEDTLPDGTCCPPMSPAPPVPCRSAPCGT